MTADEKTVWLHVFADAISGATLGGHRPSTAQIREAGRRADDAVSAMVQGKTLVTVPGSFVTPAEVEVSR